MSKEYKRVLGPVRSILTMLHGTDLPKKNSAQVSTEPMKTRPDFRKSKGSLHVHKSYYEQSNPVRNLTFFLILNILKYEQICCIE